MKKLLLALVATAAFTGSASAADLAARPYTKAPVPMAPLYNWTGFYIFGGAGGGLWNADSNVVTNPGGLAITRDQRMGGSGWYGTVGAGYDWQFNTSWVVGIFGDGQFIGGGVENNLNIFGISAPGWFMKTEYRAAFYGRVTLPETFTPAFGGGITGDSVTFKPWNQTISTSLVYRFNWGGPVVAKY